MLAAILSRWLSRAALIQDCYFLSGIGDRRDFKELLGEEKPLESAVN